MKLHFHLPAFVHRVAVVSLAIAMCGSVATAATTMTFEAFRLDLRPSPRMSSGDETLAYSMLWDCASGSTMTISQDAVPRAGIRLKAVRRAR